MPAQTRGSHASASPITSSQIYGLGTTTFEEQSYKLKLKYFPINRSYQQNFLSGNYLG